MWDFIQDEIFGMKWLNGLIGSLLSACGLDTESMLGGSLQFFIYDMIKIMVLLDSVDEKIGALAETPYINPLVRDSFLASNGLRFQLVNNHMAFYVIHEDTKIVSVISFQHSRRDWISLLQNDV